MQKYFKGVFHYDHLYTVYIMCKSVKINIFNFTNDVHTLEVEDEISLRQFWSISIRAIQDTYKKLAATPVYGFIEKGHFFCKEHKNIWLCWQTAIIVVYTTNPPALFLFAEISPLSKKEISLNNFFAKYLHNRCG